MTTAVETIGLEHLWWVRVERNAFREIGPCDEATALAFLGHLASLGALAYLCDEENADPLYCAHAVRGEPVQFNRNPPRPRHWSRKQ